MKCIDCGANIPAARLEAVPGTHHCVKCVDKHIPERKGYMIYGHKTAGEIVMATGKKTFVGLSVNILGVDDVVRYDYSFCSFDCRLVVCGRGSCLHLEKRVGVGDGLVFLLCG